MTAKRIPYGMMNFEAVRQRNMYYVDKTPFIKKVEDADSFFFFIRPRRFGKSLTISMLQHYYDIKGKDKFDTLFGDLYIGQHPTEEKNSYLVISLDFSGLAVDIGSYRTALDTHCSICFRFFCEKYKDLLPKYTLEELQKLPGAGDQLDYLCQVCYQAGQKIYLFIDEYDHFTNDILSNEEHLARYMDETHGEGYLRAFFNKIKAGTKTSLARCFMTGVSPVTLDDLTSGFNIGSNYTNEPQFNAFMGFTEEEVRAMLAYYAQFKPFQHSVDQLVVIMQPWYDNYCFASRQLGKETVYNSDMVLYFVKNYCEEGKVPANMLDNNIRVDYNKLRMLIRKDSTFAHNASVIQTLATKGFVAGTLKTSFSAATITRPDNFISLLYYFGMITISGVELDSIVFTIPNLVVKEQLFKYLLENYEQLGLCCEDWKTGDLAKNLALHGAWKAYFNYIAECIYNCASQRDKMKEGYVHGFTIAKTSDMPFYQPISELDTQAGYADIFLRPRLEAYPTIAHSYVMELKYAKASDTGSVIQQKFDEACRQLQRYAATPAVANGIGHTTLHKLVILYHGTTMKYCEEI